MERRERGPDQGVEDRMIDDEDRAIAQYRRELVATAELAERDLDEIEDHLRSLIDELRASGVPHARAVADACRRLGEPALVAHEHARVRSPFGAKLSRLRAWGAAALLAPFTLLATRALDHFGVISWFGLDFALSMIVLAALVARVTWARALMVGTLATSLASNAAMLIAMSEPPPHQLLHLACIAGALALIAPWRRGELTRAGAALALLAPGYAAAMRSLMLFITAPGGAVMANLFAIAVLAAIVLAGLGIVLRARWSALAAALAAAALVGNAQDLWGLTFRLADAGAARVLLLGPLLVSAGAAAVSAVLAASTSRSRLGTLDGVLR